MTNAEKLLVESLKANLRALPSEQERIAYCVRLLWHNPYGWGKENFATADCSGSICFGAYLLGYNIRVTADFFAKELTYDISGEMPKPGDVSIWWWPEGHEKEGIAKHIAMFSDNQIIMDADRKFVDTGILDEIRSRPGEDFEWRRLSIGIMRTHSRNGNYAYGIDEELKPLFGVLQVEQW